MENKFTYDTLYVNGDSWTAGHFIDPKLQKEGVKDCNDPRNDAYRLRNTWPHHVGRVLGLNVINGAHAGASNDRIVRSTMDDLLGLLKTKKAKDIFVMIGWSSPERKDFFYKEQNGQNGAWDTLYPAELEHWHSSDPLREDFYKSYVLRYWNVEEYYTRHILNVKMLTNFLISKRIKFKFFDCFYENKRAVLAGDTAINRLPTLASSIKRWASLQNEKYLKHVGIVNLVQQYEVLYNKHFVSPTFADYLLDKVANERKDYSKIEKYLHVHPTKLGHKEWGTYIVSKFKDGKFRR